MYTKSSFIELLLNHQSVNQDLLLKMGFVNQIKI